LLKWVVLPSRIALLLGLGAMSAAGAKAAATPAVPGGEPTRVPQQSAADFGDVRIWSEAGRIYLSEAGGDARELRLGDSAEARTLRDLLDRSGATAAAPQILPHRLVLVGGGGAGTHWSSQDESDATAGPRSAGREDRAEANADSADHANNAGAPPASDQRH
jgi:hypothetical protein